MYCLGCIWLSSPQLLMSNLVIILSHRLKIASTKEKRGGVVEKGRGPIANAKVQTCVWRTMLDVIILSKLRQLVSSYSIKRVANMNLERGVR